MTVYMSKIYSVHSWSDTTSYSLKGSNFILIRDELQVWLKCTKILEGYFVSFFFKPYISNTAYMYLLSGGNKVSKNNVVFTIECMSCFMALLLANFAKFSYLANKAKFALIQENNVFYSILNFPLKCLSTVSLLTCNIDLNIYLIKIA